MVRRAALFSPKPLPLQVAEMLNQRIARRELSDPLPGEVALAAGLGVSRGVVRKALALLASQGVIEIAQGRRTRVCPRPTRGRPGVPRILMVASGDLGRFPHGENPVVTLLRQRIEQKGWHWIEHSNPKLRTARGPQELARLWADNEPSLMVLLGSTPALQQWAERSRVPTLVLGSLAPGVVLPSVDRDYRALGWHCGGQFVAAGRREITAFVRKPVRVGDGATLEGLRAYVEGAGLPPLKVCERAGLDGGTFLRLLRRRLVPDAGWLFFHAEDLLLAYTWLLHEGRALPGEVALVAREAFPGVEALYPGVAHYRSDPQQLVRKALGMISRLIHNPAAPLGVVRLPPDFMRGASLR